MQLSELRLWDFGQVICLLFLLGDCTALSDAAHLRGLETIFLTLGSRNSELFS